MRINHVQKARKDQGRCGRCDKEIKVGDPYKWIKPRYGGKKVRCEFCQFRPSEMTSSKMGIVYDAQEDALEEIGKWCDEDAADLQEILNRFAETVREVSEEYQESCDNIRDTFSDSPTADECEEKANELDSWASEIESAASELAGSFADDFDESDVEIDPRERDAGMSEEDQIEEARSEGVDQWIEDRREQAEDVVQDCPV